MKYNVYTMQDGDAVVLVRTVSPDLPDEIDGLKVVGTVEEAQAMDIVYRNGLDVVFYDQESGSFGSYILDGYTGNDSAVMELGERAVRNMESRLRAVKDNDDFSAYAEKYFSGSADDKSVALKEFLLHLVRDQRSRAERESSSEVSRRKLEEDGVRKIMERVSVSIGESRVPPNPAKEPADMRPRQSVQVNSK